ncbi:DUF4105 domain-containing protein [uncultured Muriicola sp.]|uniref:lipoprotein N-acyltransferase Lnb domain-containing protein n=1 Tax=uncultured Muriicola sp. TaxID=1583102 RepID=UPI0026175E03|nr:DUF4105 domain-containing protein [uncultured Muriicola sp.]
MTIKHSILFVLLFFLVPTHSQESFLSEKSVVSVLTCGPGTDLYSSFGHTSFRVQDSEKGIDWIYNYGTFDFNTPNFYSKFARGKLLYSLSKQRLENFLYTYELENRWVKEQLLNLSSEEKNELFSFLEINYLPENRKYKYDFLYDNCSTKIPTILKDILGDELQFETYQDSTSYTFRDLIQQNLIRNSWSSFGIDLALGAVIDKNAAPLQYIFLPNYVLRQLEHTELHGEPIVQRERTILDYHMQNRGNFFTSSPLFWFGLLFLFTATITFIDLKNKVRSKVLDIVLFLMTGIAGCIIFFLWFLTDHQATALNFNILWAFPLNLVLVYYLIRNASTPAWITMYLLGLLILLACTVIIWLLEIQIFSPILAVLLATLAVRYSFLLYRAKKLETSTL